jgi:hypothetical protein
MENKERLEQIRKRYWTAEESEDIPWLLEQLDEANEKLQIQINIAKNIDYIGDRYKKYFASYRLARAKEELDGNE